VEAVEGKKTKKKHYSLFKKARLKTHIYADSSQITKKPSDSLLCWETLQINSIHSDVKSAKHL
jgi:hypothetical protein